MPDKTIYQQLREDGLSRRDFVKFCGLLSGMIGLEFSAAGKALGATAGRDPAGVVAQALKTKPRLPVIWLELQDCAGCTEAISRSLSPSLSNLVLNRISVDYHETLMAAAGTQAEEARRATMEKYRGQYVLVVEGSPTVLEGGAFCTIGGRSNLEILKEAAEGAAAVIATGNCAAFGGLPRAEPNPTVAHAVMDLIKDKPVINIPGCPAIPDVTTGVIAHFLVLGSPAEDGRPQTARSFLRTHHPRPLPPPAVLRGRAIRFRLRRPDGEGGLVPLQARLQGPDDLQRLFLAQVGTGAVLPRPIGPPLPGLFGAGFLGRRRILPGPIRAAQSAGGGRRRPGRRSRSRSGRRAGRGQPRRQEQGQGIGGCHELA